MEQTVKQATLFVCFSDMGWYYLSFRWWVGLWTGCILLLMVAFDLSALVRYITRFTEESFAALISIIFIKESVWKLVDIKKNKPFNPDPDVIKCFCMQNITGLPKNVTQTLNSSRFDRIHPDFCEDEGGILSPGCKTVPDVFFFSCILFMGTFLIAYGLKILRNGRFFPTQVIG